MSTTIAPAQDYLTAHLTPAANRVRVLGNKLLRVMTQLTGEVLAPADAQHLALSAAFEAFLDLGGDVDAPQTFDWSGREDELIKRGLLNLKRETLRGDSEFSDISARLTNRRNAAFVDGYRWSAWEGPMTLTNATSTGKSSTTALPEYSTELTTDRQFTEEKVASFEEDLREVLDAQSFQWLVERHRDEVSQYEQIDRFVAANPEYAGPAGRKRAEAYINKKVSRARQRAAALLADKWSGIAQDVTV